MKSQDYLKGVISTEINYIQDRDLYRYTRSAYTFLDLLGDIGGLFGALNALFSGLVLIMNYNGLNHWLASKLYRV